ncbi:transcriptional regulator [Gemmiger sp. An120]|uniref:LexA family protein n=1 Tax=Gemmiger TaxID=204475 RepID=UPI000B382C9A|nr:MULTISPECIES: XRE family transcriptional regulator [Gemmiger]MBM6915788.1 helix-turn-helix domain-containing protein [Gemmiger formicilis]OUQ41248.1 transcriptional regulator [Gemmiger sp. An120]HIX32409.1 XRE family transcriptional regulator [Candidatus Gemmiger avium]
MFSERLKALRKERKLSQAALSAQLGVTQQAVGKWETGRSTPDPATVARLAALLGTTTDVLLGVSPAPQDFGGPVGAYMESPVPVVGSVRAGYGALAFEEDYGTEPAPVKDPENYFYLVVKGDSMEPRIHDGDYALVRRQPTLNNGDLGVMVFDEGEGTLKRYIRRGNAVILQPFNPDYPEKVIRGADLERLYIAGKVVETKTKW